MKRQLCIRIPPELYEELLAQPKKEDRTLTAVIERALREYLQKAKNHVE